MARSSAFLKDLLQAPGPGNTAQLSSDATPIEIVAWVHEFEFEIFVALAYGRYVLTVWA